LFLARQAREHFVVEVGRLLPELGQACSKRLAGAMEPAGSASEIQARRDAWAGFQHQQMAWLNNSRKALQRSLLPFVAPDSRGAGGQLELVAEGSMDNQILASRLAMLVLETASSDFNDLRLRVQHLEQRQELPRGDVLLPEVTALVLVEQWLAAGMTRDAWQRVQAGMAPVLALGMHAAYLAANAFLVAGGVMKEIDLQSLVKRAPEARNSDKPSGPVAPESRSGVAFSSLGTVGSKRGALGPHEETRVLTSAGALARARQGTPGVVDQLKRLLMDKVGARFEPTQWMPAPSPRLQQAMAQALPDLLGGNGAPAYLSGSGQLARTATALSRRAAELKRAASTPSERATIEVVALMFQSIFAEERIAPSVRVWFARLQIPVLRLALAEPEFFGALQHPARRLIDRLGACALGFESNVGSAALEAEIKRVVQVIEQYPETGRRVFQLVYDDFEKFLATHLSERGSARRVVSVAQQIEQRETLSVQYTIELRKLLDDVPVRDEIRAFLFKVWVEALAVASVRHGVQHQETVALKQAAADLLWAASAKPDRSARARVIQQLPSLLRRLRQGMGLLGYPTGLQDQHIKSVSAILADAFMSRTAAIPQDLLDRLSQRLAHLEDYLPPSGVGDLDLDNESIEMITGVDASNIEVITQGDSQPDEAMRAWALELQIGSWFGLDHSGRLSSVQLAWRSQRGQLYLFVTSLGRCYLIQAARVAAYLQVGLLVPSEEEALTVRATRDALAKLEASPGRLLN
jgi:hypothetical protein